MCEEKVCTKVGLCLYKFEKILICFNTYTLLDTLWMFYVKFIISLLQAGEYGVHKENIAAEKNPSLPPPFSPTPTSPPLLKLIFL